MSNKNKQVSKKYKKLSIREKKIYLLVRDIQVE